MECNFCGKQKGDVRKRRGKEFVTSYGSKSKMNLALTVWKTMGQTVVIHFSFLKSVKVEMKIKK